jgi:hypothetical protein
MGTIRHASPATTGDRVAATGDRVAAAARRLYHAEWALHVARQTQVDAWVAAAYHALHDAVAEHRAAIAEQRASDQLLHHA